MSYGFQVVKTGFEPRSVLLQSSGVYPLSFTGSVLSCLLKVHKGFGQVHSWGFHGGPAVQNLTLHAGDIG